MPPGDGQPQEGPSVPEGSKEGHGEVSPEALGGKHWLYEVCLQLAGVV